MRWSSSVAAQHSAEIKTRRIAALHDLINQGWNRATKSQVALYLGVFTAVQYSFSTKTCEMKHQIFVINIEML